MLDWNERQQVLEDEEKLYIVMELANGEELQKHLNGLAKAQQAEEEDEAASKKDAAEGGAAAAGDATGAGQGSSSPGQGRASGSALPPAPRRKKRDRRRRREVKKAAPKPCGMPEDTARRVVRDVVCGVLHMHKCGVIHRDLKPGMAHDCHHSSLCR